MEIQEAEEEEEEEEQELKEVYRYYNMMVDAQVKPNARTFSILIEAYVWPLLSQSLTYLLECKQDR